MNKNNTTPIYKIKQSRFHQGESRIRQWFAVPEAGTPYSALFTATYWDTQSHQLAIGDWIRVEPDEGSYTADLKVISTGTGGIRVAEYYKKDWEKVAAPKALADDYHVKWAGPHHKWRVERKADSDVMESGFQSESDANRWLADNAAKLKQPDLEAA